MALKNCPNCDAIISDKSKKCPHCGIQLKKKRSTWKVPMIAGIVVVICSGFLVFKQNVHENHIWMPFNKTIERKESISHLSDEQIKMIEKYIPIVVKWYNDIDISEDIPYDFIDEKVLEMGEQILESATSGVDTTMMEMQEDQKTIFKELEPCSKIPYWVLRTYMEATSTMEFGEDGTISYITIEEEAWKEIGDAIKTAIDFYY